MQTHSEKLIKNVRSFLKDYLEPLAYLIYTIVLFLSYKNGKLFRHKVLSYYYGVSTALLIDAAVLSNHNNNWNYNLLFVLTIVVFSWYFKSLFLSDIKKKVVTICLSINILTFAFYDIIVQLFNQYNRYVYAICFITIVFYTLFYFHQLLLNVKEENLLLNFDFWLICGYLLYFLGAFIIVLYYEHADISKRGDMWAIQNVILTLSALITLQGHLRIIKEKKKL